MATNKDNVPVWVRTVVGIIAILNMAYGVMGYFSMDLLSHPGTVIDLTNPHIRSASFEFAARNLAIGLALGFVTIIKGAPEALVILTITRALIEIQTIIISMTHNNINGILLVPIVFLIVEIIIIKTLIGVIKKEEAQQLAK